MPMRKSLKCVLRPVATVLVLGLVMVSAAECVVNASKHSKRMACCVSMHGECDMAVSMPCCPPKTQASQGILVSKPSTGFVPVVALLAVLTAPIIHAPIASPRRFAVDYAASGPPGTPTYLFVSSFRI